MRACVSDGNPDRWDAKDPETVLASQRREDRRERE